MKNAKKIILLTSIIVGICLTIYYIFYTSTALLTSDSVITDVVAHYQRVNKEFILHNWYYTNEFWLFSLTIPVYLLSFFIKKKKKDCSYLVYFYQVYLTVY